MSCKECVYFRYNGLFPFCKYFGVYMSNEQAEDLICCTVPLDKRKDGMQIKQVVFDEREGDK